MMDSSRSALVSFDWWPGHTVLLSSPFVQSFCPVFLSFAFTASLTLLDHSAGVKNARGDWRLEGDLPTGEGKEKKRMTRTKDGCSTKRGWRRTNKLMDNGWWMDRWWSGADQSRDDCDWWSIGCGFPWGLDPLAQFAPLNINYNPPKISINRTFFAPDEQTINSPSTEWYIWIIMIHHDTFMIHHRIHNTVVQAYFQGQDLLFSIQSTLWNLICKWQVTTFRTSKALCHTNNINMIGWGNKVQRLLKYHCRL